MIKLDAFVQAIQNAVLRANEGLIDVGLNSMVTKFFDSGDGNSNELQEALDEALKATQNVTSQETLKQARTALKKAQDALTGGDSSRETARDPSSFKAKTVTVEYPVLIDGVVQLKDVHIPLVTLVPLNFSSIDEVKLNTDIEIYVDGDELQIDFGKSSSVKKMFDSRSRSTGHLEITLKPDEGPEGVKLLIDGYERILRAQIPG